MKQTVKDLQGDAIVATDGTLGEVRDVYFDDERWGVRYLVVDTGDWLPGRQVLLSPAAIDAGTSSSHALAAKLTREQVKSAPGVETDRPVSRQQEMALAAHYGYPYYWAGPMLWGAAPYPMPLAAESGRSPGGTGRAAEAQLAQGDSHLRSGAEVIGYDIEALDGAIGQVQDFVVDPHTWAISDVVVDTRKWWPGGHVRVSPEAVEEIDWSSRKMRLRLTRDQVRAGGS